MEELVRPPLKSLFFIFFYFLVSVFLFTFSIYCRSSGEPAALPGRSRMQRDLSQAIWRRHGALFTLIGARAGVGGGGGVGEIKR